jgi:hypothetical protein
MKFALLIVGAVLLRAAQGPTIFDITCSKDGDAVQVVTEAGRTVLDITSRSGIGGATVERKTKHWPEKMILRLHLGGLESLAVSNGELTLRASIKTYGGAARLSYGLKNGDEGPALEKDGPYWTDIKVVDSGGATVKGLPERGGWFEMVVPPALLADQAKTLEIGWIDFYRR